MNEKEMNMAILNKLYEIAFAVWAKMAKVADFGGYTAKEVNKLLGHSFCFSEGQDADEIVSVNVGNYECSFPAKMIFRYVAIFEGLAKIGKNAKQFVFEEAGECLGSVTLHLNKSMSELCKFVGKDELRPVMSYIVLDAANKSMVASSGRKLLSLPVDILECHGDVSNFFIDTKQFALMCKKMDKNGSYIVTATKSKVGFNEYTKIEFLGITSNVQKDRNYPNWKAIIPYVSNELAINLGKFGAWKEIKKATKKANDYVIFMSGKSGDDYITLEYDDCKRNFMIGGALRHNFRIGILNDYIKSCEQIDMMYLGKDDKRALVCTNNQGGIYLFVPAFYADEERETYIRCNNADFDIYVLDERTNNRTQSIESAKVNDNTIEQTNEPESAKNEPAKEQTKAERKVTLDADVKKFAFAKVGIKPGDVLTFIDGTQVIAAENNMVELCGKTFTLSGFCKEFMPDEKRSKSNSYRGCAYFFLNGVKLEKLFKEYQKAQANTLEAQTEEVASEQMSDTLRNTINAQVKWYLENVCYILGEDGKPRMWNVIKYLEDTDEFVIECLGLPNAPTWTEDRRQFAQRYHSMSITEAKYLALLKSSLEEPTESAQESIETTEQGIAPSGKGIAAERKELAKNANNMVYDISTIGKVVLISLGVPPECAEAVSGAIPVTPGQPNIFGVRPAVAGARLNNAAVGGCLGVAGKVVHTLPLPPPGRKRISELTTYINYYNTS